MPGRYTKKLQVAKLKSSPAVISTVNDDSIDDSDAAPSGSESDEEVDSLHSKSNRDPDNMMRHILEVTPHFTHPGLNKGLGAAETFLMHPTCAVTMPMPIYIANRRTPIIEPCTLRTSEMDQWLRHVHRCQVQYNRHTKKMNQREKKHQQNIYNINLYDMAEHIATQQNMYFRDSYDYHYTGGNVALMPFSIGQDSRTVALHASGAKLQQLNLSQLDEGSDQLQSFYSKAFTELSSEIFELLPMRSFRVNHGHMFMMRCLNDIVINELKLENDADYELVCQSKYSSHEGPFISAAQAMGDANTLAIACQDRTVRFLDIVQNQDISIHSVCMLKKLKQTCNAWAQLLAAQDSSFYYACQTALLTIDVRCGSEAINPCFASSAYAQQCETLSYLARSINPNLLYVGSNHKLHCLDMRCLGKKLSDRAVVTWTHQMTYPPTFMDTCDHEGTEYVALCSPLPSDQRLCELKGALAQSVTEMSSPALPYAPPTLDEALTDAQFRGHVDVYADLAERIKSCTTGLKFHKLENADDGAFAQLLSVNSVGDVYCQRLTERDALEFEQERRTGLHTAEAVRCYGGLVKAKVKEKELFCTEVQNIPVLRDVMKSEREIKSEQAIVPEDTTIKYNFEESEAENDESFENNESQGNNEKAAELQSAGNQNPPKSVDKTIKKKRKALNRGAWQKSAHQLTKYTDVITSRLLDVWNIDEEYDVTRDVNIDMIDEKLNQDQPTPSCRTESWITHLPAGAPINCEANEPLVDGTAFPKLYEATYADYEELAPAGVVPDIKTEADLSFGNQAHSTLQPGYAPTRAKRPKTKAKYQMGF